MCVLLGARKECKMYARVNMTTSSYSAKKKLAFVTFYLKVVDYKSNVLYAISFER